MHHDEYMRQYYLDQTLQVFTDEERKELWKFLYRVIDKKVSKDEFETRMGQIERAIEMARENRRRGA